MTMQLNATMATKRKSFFIGGEWVNYERVKLTKIILSACINLSLGVMAAMAVNRKKKACSAQQQPAQFFNPVGGFFL
jgi:hypothetical protein